MWIVGRNKFPLRKVNIEARSVSQIRSRIRSRLHQIQTILQANYLQSAGSGKRTDASADQDRSRSQSKSKRKPSADSSRSSKARRREDRQVSPVPCSSDSDHNLTKEKEKSKKSKRKSREPSKGKQTRASTWDMLAYLWPVCSRPAHLQREAEVNRWA